jgi:hypothetical protein
VRIDHDQLKILILEVAHENFGNRDFERRPLMLATEKKLREKDLWTGEDDEISGSVGIKSKGLANIDWRITNLKDEGRLLNTSRNIWRLPQN